MLIIMLLMIWLKKGREFGFIGCGFLNIGCMEVIVEVVIEF